MKITLLQRNIVWADPQANMVRNDSIFQSDGGSDLYIFPEMFSTGFCTVPEGIAEPLPSATLGWMKDKASRNNCAIAGSVAVQEDGKYFNRFYFVHPDGTVDQYDKRHLFFGGEDASYTHGTDRVILEYKGWRILLGTCFDLRFPVWMRNDGNDPYDLYINVANWPAARRKAAEVLAAARAIENVCYVAFCNRAGHDPLLAYDGGSSVINHRGRVRSVSSRVMDTDVVYAVLDMAEMLRFRASFPILGLVDRHNLL